jgi:L-iditol 2-dehydrogenase
MKALVLKEYRNLVYEDVPTPEAGVDDVLIRVEACGICGSDVHGYHGRTGRRIRTLLLSESVADSGMGPARERDWPLAVGDGA